MKEWLFSRTFSIFEVFGIVIASDIDNLIVSTLVFFGWMGLSYLACKRFNIKF